MILIKYPTRQRPELFKKTIENIYSTISHQVPFLVQVTCDLGDGLMHNVEISNWLKRFGNLTITYSQNQSKVEAINGCMPDYNWHILVNMSDDMKWVEQDWDLKLIEACQSVWGFSLDFFAHFNDGFVGDALATMSIMGVDYYKRDNYIYYPGYKSFSCDAEAYYVAKARGRHHYFDQILFRHLHPANVKVDNDSLFKQNSVHTEHDTKLYWDRLHNDFDMAKEGISGPFPWDWEKKPNYNQ